jgi:signal transduction histidine kinase
MEVIGHLADGIAHDFNNLLTAILGYSELLTEQIGPDLPMGRDLREIMKAAQRASALTRQLLAFSRRQVLVLAPIDLNRVITNLETMLRRLVGNGITLKTVLAPGLRPVMADAIHMEQVLINLAVNARDAMPKGGTLSIETHNADLDARFAAHHAGARPGAFAMLSVGDTGMGMSREIQERIFEPFFTTRIAAGTGSGRPFTASSSSSTAGSISTASQRADGLPRLPAGNGSSCPGRRSGPGCRRRAAGPSLCRRRGRCVPS